MSGLTKSDWEAINEFLLSVSEERTIDGLRSRILTGVPSLIGFGGSGCLIRINGDRPRIVDSIQSERKWIEYFNHYYYRIATPPGYGGDTYSADATYLKKFNSDEYIHDFLGPQRISSSAGLVLFDERGRPDFTYVFNRSSSERMFDEPELEKLNVVQRHIERQYRLLQKIEGLRRLPVMRIELAKGSGLLSRRESEVAHLLFRRMKPAEIAADLQISPLTVKKHIANIYGKLNIKDRRQLLEKLGPEMDGDANPA
jgi:DNA-binding CsgD family transcriptional regulator